MKKTFAIASMLIVISLILLSTGIVTVFAGGGPTPVGVLIKHSNAQVIVVGAPEGFSVAPKVPSQFSVIGSPQEEATSTLHP